MTVYDSLWIGPDTDSDGLNDLVCGDLCAGFLNPAARWFFGIPPLAWVHEVEFTASTVASVPELDGLAWSVNFPDSGNGEAEPLILLATMFDSPVTGLDTDGDGQVDSPYSRTDADGDGLVDELTAGVLLTIADTETNGDGIADVFNFRGAGFLNAFGLTDGGTNAVSGEFPSGDSDGDGDPDGALEILFRRQRGPGYQRRRLPGFRLDLQRVRAEPVESQQPLLGHAGRGQLRLRRGQWRHGGLVQRVDLVADRGTVSARIGDREQCLGFVRGSDGPHGFCPIPGSADADGDNSGYW